MFFCVFLLLRIVQTVGFKKNPAKPRRNPGENGEQSATRAVGFIFACVFFAFSGFPRTSVLLAFSNAFLLRFRAFYW